MCLNGAYKLYPNSSKCISPCTHCPGGWVLRFGLTGSPLPEYRTFALNKKVLEIPLSQGIFKNFLEQSSSFIHFLTFPASSLNISLESSCSFWFPLKIYNLSELWNVRFCLKLALQESIVFLDFRRKVTLPVSQLSVI